MIPFLKCKFSCPSHISQSLKVRKAQKQHRPPAAFPYWRSLLKIQGEQLGIDPDSFYRRQNDARPLTGPGTVEDVAWAVFFFRSDMSRWITGSSLVAVGLGLREKIHLINWRGGGPGSDPGKCLTILAADARFAWQRNAEGGALVRAGIHGDGAAMFEDGLAGYEEPYACASISF